MCEDLRYSPSVTPDGSSPTIRERRRRSVSRYRMKGYFRRLGDAIQRLHGCAAKHVQTVPLTEQVQGKIRWQGKVEMFDVSGHATATRCYAWAYLEGDKERYIAVLEIPPV